MFRHQVAGGGGHLEASSGEALNFIFTLLHFIIFQAVCLHTYSPLQLLKPCTICYFSWLELMATTTALPTSAV